MTDDEDEFTGFTSHKCATGNHREGCLSRRCTCWCHEETAIIVEASTPEPPASGFALTYTPRGRRPPSESSPRELSGGAVTINEVSKRTGATFRQIDHWIRSGLIAPSLGAACGSGSSRKFSERDIALVAVGKILANAGLDLKYLRPIGEALDDLDDAEFGVCYLVLSDGLVQLLYSPDPEDLGQIAFHAGHSLVSVIAVPTLGRD